MSSENTPAKTRSGLSNEEERRERRAFWFSFFKPAILGLIVLAFIVEKDCQSFQDPVDSGPTVSVAENASIGPKDAFFVWLPARMKNATVRLFDDATPLDLETSRHTHGGITTVTFKAPVGDGRYRLVVAHQTSVILSRDVKVSSEAVRRDSQPVTLTLRGLPRAFHPDYIKYLFVDADAPVYAVAWAKNRAAYAAGDWTVRLVPRSTGYRYTRPGPHPPVLYYGDYVDTNVLPSFGSSTRIAVATVASDGSYQFPKTWQRIGEIPLRALEFDKSKIWMVAVFALSFAISLFEARDKHGLPRRVATSQWWGMVLPCVALVAGVYSGSVQPRAYSPVLAASALAAVALGAIGWRQYSKSSIPSASVHLESAAWRRGLIGFIRGIGIAGFLLIGLWQAI